MFPSSSTSLSRLLNNPKYLPAQLSIHLILTTLTLSPDPSPNLISTASMNRRTRSIPASAESFNRFLKPGALARLRDSQITARSHRFHNLPSFRRSPSFSSSPPVPASPSGSHLLIDVSPCFYGKMYGLRFPQRKKLVAARFISYFISPSLVAADAGDSAAVDVFGTDIAAH